MEVIRGNLDTVQEIEKEEGKGWIKLIYAANGVKALERTVQNG